MSSVCIQTSKYMFSTENHVTKMVSHENQKLHCKLENLVQRAEEAKWERLFRSQKNWWHIRYILYENHSYVAIEIVFRCFTRLLKFLLWKFCKQILAIFWVFSRSNHLYRPPLCFKKHNRWPHYWPNMYPEVCQA